MKSLKNISKICVALVLLASVFCSCQQEELVKPHALLAESSLTFEAIGAKPQLLTIASDEDWVIDAPEWITVDPAYGSQTVKVTVSVADNVDKNNEMNSPRQAAIIISSTRDGYSIESVIYQNGDNYKGVREMTISEAAAIEDEAFAKIPDAQVVALTADGFVAEDNTASMYVLTKETVAIGDKVSLAGKKSTLYSLSVLEAGEVTVKSNEEFERPAPVDLLANIDPSKANSIVYVSVKAGLLGRTLVFDQVLPVSVTLLDPRKGDVDIDAVNMHNVGIEAYFVGLDKTNVMLAVTSIEDLGLNDDLDAYFFDDFSWMKSYIDASGEPVGDSVGENKSDAKAPNLRTVTNLKPLLDALLERGYMDLNPNEKVIYPQAYYWKFSRTNGGANHNNGMILPHIEFKGSEQVNVNINFDWAAHMTGTGVIDDVQIVVELDGAGVFDNGTKISDPLYTSQVNGKLEWQHASVLAKGVNNTTKITLRPLNYNEVLPNVQRWHLDNIKIKDTGIPYAEPVFANLSVSEEVVTFEGNPISSASVKILSDKTWSLTKGQNSDWFDFDVTSGLPEEETTVTITCQPSNSTSLRHGVITIASADTRKNIHVVQSAAGGDLDPLISVVGGNYITVLGEGQEFSAKVQANVDYEIETSEWIEVVPMPATKAMVEVREHLFKAAVNMTGSSRTGFVKFRNGNLETVLNVTQENFEPKMSITLPSQVCFIPASGMTVPVQIESNVDFTISSNVLTLPVSDAPSGSYDMEFTVPENTGLSRDVTVTMENEYYSHTYTFKIEQHGTDVIFADDFSWLKPIVDAVNPDGSGNYDTVGSKDLSAIAPNIYGTAAMKAAFVPICNQMGYYIPGKDDGANDVLYLQDCYLKLGKTGSSSQTSLTLPSVDPAGKDMTVSFDWARMVQGSGTVDNYTLTLMIEGNGTFENGTKYSDELSTPQAKGEIFWTNFSVKVSGADANTKITFVPTDLVNKSTGKIDYKKTGGKRAFYDNIVVKVN